MGNVIYDMLCDVIEREGKLMSKLENLANMMLDFFNQGEQTKEATRAEEKREPFTPINKCYNEECVLTLKCLHDFRKLGNHHREFGEEI